MSAPNDVVALTKRLVAAESHDGTTEEAACAVAMSAMQALGYADVRRDALGNVVGRVTGNGSSQGCVVFDGHVDTVGVGDASTWASDPFAATERDGFLYGRGVADMKGAIAAMIVGVARLRHDPIAGDVIVSV